MGLMIVPLYPLQGRAPTILAWSRLPFTRSVLTDCARASCTMTQAIALTAPAALGLFCASYHEPFHAHRGQESMAVTERSRQKPPQRRCDLPWPDRTVNHAVSIMPLHCRIKPYLDQGGAASGTAGRRQRSASALEGPAGARRPQPQPATNHAGSSGMHASPGTVAASYSRSGTI